MDCFFGVSVPHTSSHRIKPEKSTFSSGGALYNIFSGTSTPPLSSGCLLFPLLFQVVRFPEKVTERFSVTFSSQIPTLTLKGRFIGNSNTEQRRKSL
jgi:hypothetical protein